MKLYTIEITSIAVIAAEDEEHAIKTAQSMRNQIFFDDANPRIESDGEIKNIDDLSHGWDGECIPYGGDGNTRIKDLMPPNAEANRPAR